MGQDPYDWSSLPDQDFSSGYDWSSLPDQPVRYEMPSNYSTFNPGERMPGEPYDVPNSSSLMGDLLGGAWDTVQEAHNYASMLGKTGAEQFGKGDYSGLLQTMARPFTDPVEAGAGLVGHYFKGDAPVRTGQEAFGQAAGVIGFPGESFTKAWETENYPRLIGQGVGALAGMGLGLRSVGKDIPSVRPLGTEPHIQKQPRYTETTLGGSEFNPPFRGEGPELGSMADYRGPGDGPVNLAEGQTSFDFDTVQGDLPFGAYRAPSGRMAKSGPGIAPKFGPEVGEMPLGQPSMELSARPGTETQPNFFDTPPPPPAAAPAAPATAAPPQFAGPKAPIFSPDGNTVTLQDPGDAATATALRGMGFVPVQGLRDAQGRVMMAKGTVAPLYLTGDKRPPAPKPTPTPTAAPEGLLSQGEMFADDVVAVPQEVVNANKHYISNMADNGYKLVSQTPTEFIFRLLKETGGSLDIQALWQNLKMMLGRDPTIAEVEAYRAREMQPGEQTGRVLPIQGGQPIAEGTPPVPREGAMTIPSQMEAPGLDVGPLRQQSMFPPEPQLPNAVGPERLASERVNEGPFSVLLDRNGIYTVVDAEGNRIGAYNQQIHAERAAREMNMTEAVPGIDTPRPAPMGQQELPLGPKVERGMETEPFVRDTSPDQFLRRSLDAERAPAQQSMIPEFQDAEMGAYLNEQGMAGGTATARAKNAATRFLGDEEGSFNPRELWNKITGKKTRSPQAQADYQRRMRELEEADTPEKLNAIFERDRRELSEFARKMGDDIASKADEMLLQLADSDSAYENKLRLTRPDLFPPSKGQTAEKVQYLDQRKAPDIAYRELAPLYGELKPGETWRDVVTRFLKDEEGAMPVPLSDDYKKVWNSLKEKSGWGTGARNADTLESLGVIKALDAMKQNLGWGKGVKDKTGEESFLTESLAVPTNLTTTGDLSAPGRQGLALINTKHFWQAGGAMFKGFTPKGFDQIDASLKSKYLFRKKINKDGTAGKSPAEEIGTKLFAPAGKAPFTNRAQGAASRWIETGGILGPEKIAGIPNPLRFIYNHTVGYPIRASNRMYITFLNHLNANRTEFLMNKLKDMSLDALKTGEGPREGVMGSLGFRQKYTPEQAASLNPYRNLDRGREIADFVNTATGHGPLRTYIVPWQGTELNLESASSVLSKVMFSPGLFASRVRMLSPANYIMASPFVRKQYLKAALSTAAAWYGFTQLAKLADPDAEVNDDWTSADFGKIRIGDTRMDASGGFAPFLVMYGRWYQGGMTSSASNEFHRFGQEFQAETQWSNAERFMTNKLNPVAKFAYDLADATKYKPVHMGDRTMQLFTPLIIQDMVGLYHEDPALLPWMAPVAFGMGTQTYERGESVGKLLAPENDWIYKGDAGISDAIPEGVIDATTDVFPFLENSLQPKP